MSRVVILHWNSTEAASGAAVLRRSGHEVVLAMPDSSPALRKLREHLPDLFILDLTRRPSHLRSVASALRENRTTRPIPLLFAGGDEEKVEATRTLFPDAAYAPWSRIRSSAVSAIRHAPVRPIVVKSMSGYSGTPLPKKLGVKPGCLVALLGAPDDFAACFEGIEGVRFTTSPREQAQVVLAFVRSMAELELRLPQAILALANAGALWIVYPKKASGMRTDLTQNLVRDTLLPLELVDYKVCAVDATWTGLCFARRKAKAAGK